MAAVDVSTASHCSTYGKLVVLRKDLEDKALEAWVASTLRLYPTHRELLEVFLRSYESPGLEVNVTQDGAHGRKKYLNKLHDIHLGASRVLRIEGDDILQHFRDESGDNGSKHDVSVAKGVFTNTPRYLQLICEAATSVIQSVIVPKANELNQVPLISNAVKEKLKLMEKASVPLHIRSPFEIQLVPPSTWRALPLRALRAWHVGCLIKTEGIVVRVSSVKPRIAVARYKCVDCGASIFQPIEGLAFMPLLQCNSPACVRNKKGGELRTLLRECKFVKYQEVRVQEPPSHVPAGHVPRVQKLIIEGDLTRRLSPGMSITLGGLYMPVIRTGLSYAAARFEPMATSTYFKVHSIDIHKEADGSSSLTAAESQLAAGEAEKIFKTYEDDPELYDKLAQSVAPGVHGMEDVKKVLLLQLVGGVTQKLADGMKVRGDIHVLLMGDPGVAKSQLLNQCCKIASRAHYTTGKGASGVGLTASVQRDPLTGEFTLEGGAIVLADNGICSIDEFDKMTEYDRTAIHEVMEQQTVSVSKAGLTATLNARTSILAAANPIYSRYDVKKSPLQNMGIPSALLSRFDIQYLLLDRPDLAADTQLARYVLSVHQTLKPPGWNKEAAAPRQRNGDRRNRALSAEQNLKYFDAETLRLFIARAKSYQPVLHRALTKEIVESYVSFRKNEKLETQRNEFNTYTTPRTLLAVLRLSQAIARLRCSNTIERGDFEEALRLIQESKSSVILAQARKAGGALSRDFRSRVMEIAKNLQHVLTRNPEWDGWVPLLDILQRAINQKISESDVLQTLEEYVELEVLVWRNAQKSHVAFCG